MPVCSTYWKHEGDASSHGLRSIKVGFGTEKQILFSIRAFPGDDRRAIEENFDKLARRQTGGDTRVVFGHQNLGSR